MGCFHAGSIPTGAKPVDLSSNARLNPVTAVASPIDQPRSTAARSPAGVAASASAGVGPAFTPSKKPAPAAATPFDDDAVTSSAGAGVPAADPFGDFGAGSAAAPAPAQAGTKNAFSDFDDDIVV
jgi:hypothetical protein